MKAVIIVGLLVGAVFAGSLYYLTRPGGLVQLGVKKGVEAVHDISKQREQDRKYEQENKRLQHQLAQSKAEGIEAIRRAERSEKLLESKSRQLDQKRKSLAKAAKHTQQLESQLASQEKNVLTRVEQNCPDVAPMLRRSQAASNAVIADLRRRITAEKTLRLQTETALQESRKLLGLKDKIIASMQKQIATFSKQKKLGTGYIGQLKSRKFRLGCSVGAGGGYGASFGESGGHGPTAMLGIVCGISF